MPTLPLHTTANRCYP